jgi:hypothetical protein
MRTQFTDKHIQIESGNDIFERGLPRQVVRRRFPGKGVIWFEKPVASKKNLERIDVDTAEQLENKFSSNRDSYPANVIIPSEF